MISLQTHMLPLFCVILLCFIGGTQGDSVLQNGTMVLAENEKASLYCKYDTTDTAPYLYWYIQLGKTSPELILSNLNVNGKAFKEGFKANPDKSAKTFNLEIAAAGLSDSATYYCALNNGIKIIFGQGTQLIVQPNVPSDPVYYKLEAEDKSVKACLAADFSNYSAANEGTFKNITATRIQGESLFSKVVAWTTDDDKCSEFGKERGDTGRCDSDAYFETDEKVNFLSLTVLGLRILFLKSIVFNVLMTLRAWMS